MMTCILSCEKDNQHEKFFDSDNLGLLDLANIVGFWDDDEIIDTSYYMGAIFERYSGFLEGIRLYGEDKAVWISVFSAQDTAINAMESKINNVACVIQEGISDIISGRWWFSDCIPNIVIVNQWNTIITVDYYHTDFESVESILYNTANELVKRVDNLSK